MLENEALRKQVRIKPDLNYELGKIPVRVYIRAHL